MRDPLTVPAEAYAPDADRAGPDASAHLPEWLVQCLVLLLLFLAKHGRAARLRRSRQVQAWWQERPDLPAGSIQALAASIRGPFGRAIASMCRRHGIGPGHPEWPELSRAIVAFGGSLRGFRAGAPPLGLHWWENPNIVPGMSRGFGVPAAATVSVPQPQAFANAAPPAPDAMQGEAAHASFPASWLSASGRQVFARAGPAPSTGPPRCPGLPITVMHDERGRSTAGPAVLIRADRAPTGLASARHRPGRALPPRSPRVAAGRGGTGRAAPSRRTGAQPGRRPHLRTAARCVRPGCFAEGSPDVLTSCQCRIVVPQRTVCQNRLQVPA